MTAGQVVTPEGHVDDVGCWCGPHVDPVAGLMHTLDPARNKIAETLLRLWEGDVDSRLDDPGVYGAALREYLDALMPTVQEVIADEVAPLHAFAIQMINAPDDSAADWGYDLAHRLGMTDPTPIDEWPEPST